MNSYDIVTADCWRMVCLTPGESFRIMVDSCPRILFVARGRVDVRADGLRSRKSRVVVGGEMTLIYGMYPFTPRAHEESVVMVFMIAAAAEGRWAGVVEALRESTAFAFGDDVGVLLGRIHGKIVEGLSCDGFDEALRVRLLAGLADSSSPDSSSSFSSYSPAGSDVSAAKQRLLAYLACKGVSRRDFARATGLSEGFFRRDKGIRSSHLEIISGAYADLNLLWLITGKGDMLTGGPMSGFAVSPSASGFAVSPAASVISVASVDPYPGYDAGSVWSPGRINYVFKP